MSYRFNLYEQWRDTPEYEPRPFKVVGRAVKSLESHLKIISYLKRTTVRKLLLVIKGKDGYENAIVAEPKELIRFLQNLTADLHLTLK